MSTLALLCASDATGRVIRTGRMGMRDFSWLVDRKEDDEGLLLELQTFVYHGIIGRKYCCLVITEYLQKINILILLLLLLLLFINLIVSNKRPVVA